MLKNILANFIGRLWGTLSNFLFIPLYIHYLGFNSYSVISFTLVIAGLMAILDAGITATLSRELARLDNTGADKILIFRTLELIYFSIVIFAIVSLFLCSDSIAKNWINTQSFSISEVSYMLKIISFDIGFQLLFRFYMGGMFGLEEQIKANVYQVGWGMLRNGLVIVSIYISPTLETFFIWQAASSLIFAFMARASLYKLLFINFFSCISKFEIKILADVWRFAGGMFLIAIVAAINSQLDKLVISVLLPIEILGYYTLCVSLALGLVMLVSPFSTALLPKLTALYSTGSQGKASDLFNKFVLLVSIIVFSFMANMIFNSMNILWIWTGDTLLATSAAIYLPIILFSYAMLALAILPFTIAVANGYTKINNILGMLSLLVTLPGYWLGGKYYGAIGAATVYCITQTMITFIYFYLIDKRFIQNNRIFKFYFLKILIPLFLTLSCAYCFSYMPEFKSDSRILSLMQLMVEICFCVLMSIAVLMPSFSYRFTAIIRKKFVRM